MNNQPRKLTSLSFWVTGLTSSFLVLAIIFFCFALKAHRVLPYVPLASISGLGASLTLIVSALINNRQIPRAIVDDHPPKSRLSGMFAIDDETFGKLLDAGLPKDQIVALMTDRQVHIDDGMKIKLLKAGIATEEIVELIVSNHREQASQKIENERLTTATTAEIIELFPDNPSTNRPT